MTDRDEFGERPGVPAAGMPVAGRKPAAGRSPQPSAPADAEQPSESFAEQPFESLAGSPSESLAGSPSESPSASSAGFPSGGAELSADEPDEPTVPLARPGLARDPRPLIPPAASPPRPVEDEPTVPLTTSGLLSDASSPAVPSPAAALSAGRPLESSPVSTGESSVSAVDSADAGANFPDSGVSSPDSAMDPRGPGLNSADSGVDPLGSEADSPLSAAGSPLSAVGSPAARERSSVEAADAAGAPRTGDLSDGDGETSATSPDPSISDTPEAVADKGDLDRPARRRPAPAGTLIWVLLALLGFTLVVQVRSNDADQGLSTARQEDLVRILSDLEAQDSRLLAEIQAMERTRGQLSSGVEGREAALAEASKRNAELGLLAGTVPGRGPGLEIALVGVKASDVLNAVQELRGAGGEVMQLNGANNAAVRIVASSYFVDAADGGIIADGKRLSGPFRLLVIGSPETMSTALQIPGGVVASVKNDGGSVTMDSRSLVEVTEVRKAAALQYARPVS
ncbi:hypothetical protein Acsp01_07110 [Actinoplanes sp. NBRC 101535]|nr:hypothetical protein Acsp01_07110 [Actinoplanes sp. NBRC 101535]